MSQITTHILDTSRGMPAAEINITLSQLNASTWQALGQGSTNEDGRIQNLTDITPLQAGTYSMKFDLENYFSKMYQTVFYPWVEVVFNLDGSGSHYHIPLLISPYGYSTYRGS